MGNVTLLGAWTGRSDQVTPRQALETALAVLDDGVPVTRALVLLVDDADIDEAAQGTLRVSAYSANLPFAQHVALLELHKVRLLHDWLP
jgi:hypothetical protein